MVGLYPLADAYKVAKKQLDKDKEEEHFVTEDETKKSVANIFISVGLMILALLIGGLLFWAYRKERALMIVILCVLIFIYSLVIMTLGIVQRNKLDKGYFLSIVGSSIFITVMMLILIIMFSIIASRRLNKSYLGTETQDYLSRTTEL